MSIILGYLFFKIKLKFFWFLPIRGLEAELKTREDYGRKTMIEFNGRKTMIEFKKIHKYTPKGSDDTIITWEEGSSLFEMHYCENPEGTFALNKSEIKELIKALTALDRIMESTDAT